ncbi:MAG: type II secretion system F family protein [Myxococcota bacterium]
MWLILALVFGSVLFLGLAVSSLGQTAEQKRLAQLAAPESATDIEDEEGVLTSQDKSLLARLLAPFAGDLTRRRAGVTDPLRRSLVHAGFRQDSALANYMGGRVALALALPLLILLIPGAWGLSQFQLVGVLCLAACIGVLAPRIWLDRQVEARQKAIILALPDALDLMVVCVEAGLGVSASLARVARDFRPSYPILASEFDLAVFETRAGKSTTDALRGLAERTGVGEMNSLVSMLIQTERFGTGLADTLRVHADAMRTRRIQSAEEQANKAPLKMVFPTAFIFVAMIIIVVGPGFLQLAQYFAGAGR